MNDAVRWIEYAGRFLEALNCGALVVSRAGQVTRANRRMCRMMQRLPRDLVGKSLIDFYDAPESRAFILDRRANFDRPWEGEFYLPQPDGSRRPVIISSRVLGAEPPLCDLRLVTLTDISVQKHAEARLKEQYDVIANLSTTILDQAVDLKDYSHTLEARVAERTAALHEANLDAIYMLAVASEAKDEDTGRHVRRIRRYAKALAAEMGIAAGDAEEIGYSAVLHDVGKMHVPDHILKKPGPLTPAASASLQASL